jgi:hypothetical protein
MSRKKREINPMGSGRRWLHHCQKQKPSVGFSARVARRLVFSPKISIWVNFAGPQNGKYWNILWPFGIFHSNLVMW